MDVSGIAAHPNSSEWGRAAIPDMAQEQKCAKIEGSTSQVCTVVCADLRNH